MAGSDLSSGLLEKEGSRAGGSNDTGERPLGYLDLWRVGGRWPAATRQLAAGFINATAANVSHPFDDIVVAVVQLRFEYLQVAHLEARRREWHLGRGQLQLGIWPFYHSTSKCHGSPTSSTTGASE